MASYGSNAIQGLGTGAAAGASFGPWGVLAGGSLGLAAGLFSAWEEAEDEKRKQDILRQAAQQLNTSTAELKALAKKYYDENPSTGRKEDVTKYRELIDKYDPNEFEYNEKNLGVSLDFDKDKYNVEDYYAPNKQAIIDKTADAIQARAAGQGVGRGTGAANAIATGVAEKNEELYKDALAARNADRQFAYSLWQANIQNAQNRLKSLQEGSNTQMSLYGNMAEDYQNWQNANFQHQLDLDKQRMQNDLSLTLASI
jgi:hypothetical protein